MCLYQDHRCHGPLGGPDRAGLPSGRPARGATPGQDGAMCSSAQVPGPDPHHRLHAVLQGTVCTTGSGFTKTSRHAVQEMLLCEHLQRSHGLAPGFSGSHTRCLTVHQTNLNMYWSCNTKHCDIFFFLWSWLYMFWVLLFWINWQIIACFLFGGKKSNEMKSNAFRKML